MVEISAEANWYSMPADVALLLHKTLDEVRAMPLRDIRMIFARKNANTRIENYENAQHR